MIHRTEYIYCGYGQSKEKTLVETTHSVLVHFSGWMNKKGSQKYLIAHIYTHLVVFDI